MAQFQHFWLHMWLYIHNVGVHVRSRFQHGGSALPPPPSGGVAFSHLFFGGCCLSSPPFGGAAVPIFSVAWCCLPFSSFGWGCFLSLFGLWGQNPTETELQMLRCVTEQREACSQLRMQIGRLEVRGSVASRAAQQSAPDPGKA